MLENNDMPIIMIMTINLIILIIMIYRKGEKGRKESSIIKYVYYIIEEYRTQSILYH